MNDLPEGLQTYFAQRAQAREARFNEKWNALTAREQTLVREAAVMGYVRGSMFGQYRSSAEADAEFPKDTEIIKDVFGGCDAHSDLYPLISHLDEEVRLTPDFDAWLTKNGVTNIGLLSADQRHAGYLNYLRSDDDDEDEGDED